MNDLLLKAFRKEPVERTPIWLMRQAGRSLPEYRALREQHGFSTLLRTPELATEVTLQPIDRLGVDGAILFSDILVPAECLGCRVEFQPAPVLERALDSADAIRRLAPADPEERVPFVFETLRMLRTSLAGRVPVIGFAATPFTLAAYLVEGRGARGFPKFKKMLFGDPALAHRLLEAVCATTEAYVAAQVAAGAQAIQLFDSWIGVLAAKEYREFGLPYTRRVFDRLAGSGVPRIYFALDSTHLLDEIGECGADVLGLDWRVRLADVASRFGDRFAFQGNLDPTILLAPREVIELRALELLEQARHLPGHVFNLGHGVLPETPVEHIQALVDAVQHWPHSERR